MDHNNILEKWRQTCRQRPGVVAMPDAEDPRVLAVAARVLAEGSAARVVLFGNRQTLLALAARHGVDLSAHADRIAFEPGATGAERLGQAAEMAAAGTVDAVIAGNISTTAEVIRSGISGVGLAAGVRTVSGAFMMNKPGERLYLYADCGVVIAPTVRQLVDIATESVRTWRHLVPEVPPVLAFLSFSTKGSANHETQARMAEAADLFRRQQPEVESDGELQFDAAFDADIGRRKAPDSPVPGRANCFVFPDLGAGNIAYKITQRLAGFEAYGPILQGLARPYSDLSRGATVADILASVYINLLRARA